MKIINTKIIEGATPENFVRIFEFSDGYRLLDAVRDDGIETTTVYTKTRKIVEENSKQFKKYDRIAFNYYNPSRSKY